MKGFKYLALFLSLIFACLGTWQFHRWQWKEQLIAERAQVLKASPVPFRTDANEIPLSVNLIKASLEGILKPHLAFFIGPRTWKGKAGFHVLAPLEYKPNQHIWIDLGWVPYKNSFSSQGKPDTITFQGILRRDGKSNFWIPDNVPEKAAWHFVDTVAMSQERHIPSLYGSYLIALDPIAESAKKVGYDPAFAFMNLPNNHSQYMMIWYAFALIIWVIYFVAKKQKVLKKSQ